MDNVSNSAANSVRQTVWQVARYALILNGVVAASAFFWSSRPVAYLLGAFFGIAIGILNFYELALTLEKAVQMAPGKATQYASLKYFLRFLVTAVVLFVAIKSPQLNVLGTVFGLVSIKFVVFAMNLLNKKKAPQ